MVSTTLPLATVGIPRGYRRRLDLPEILFLVAAAVAPLNLLIVANISVFDVVMLVLAFLLYAGTRRMHPMPAAVSVASYVFVLSAMVSTFRATHPVEALTQVLQFAVILFVQVPVVLTMARSRVMLRWGLLLFMAGSFAGVVQALLTQNAQGADRVLVFYSDNPNRLGYPTAYLVPFVAFFLFAVWRSRRRVVAAVLGVGLGYLLVWPLTASASRGATFGTLVAILLYFVTRPGRGLLRVVGALAVTAALVGAIGWVMVETTAFPQTLEERVTRTLEPEERETLVGDRERLAAAGLRAFEQSPLVGTGLDNFRYVAVLYEPAATNQVPHNLWIQFLAQVGLVGTVAFAFIIGWWFLQLYRASKAAAGTDEGTLAWAFVASMAGIMTILMTTPIMNQRHYWLVYGLGLALVASEDRRGHAQRDRISEEGN